MQRLQSEGGAAVMQSGLDSRVINAINLRWESMFVAGGKKYKAGSDIARAAEKAAAALAEIQAKQSSLTELEDARESFEQAGKTIAEKNRSLRTAKTELTAAKEAFDRAKRIQEQLAPLYERILKIDEELASLNSIAEDLTDYRRKQQDLQEQLKAIALGAKAVQADEQSSREALKAAELAENEARKQAAQAGLQLKALSDQITKLERLKNHQDLSLIFAKISALRDTRDSLCAKHSDIPEITRENLAELRGVEQEIVTARGQLDALGARIELVETQESVLVDGKDAAVGSTVVVANDAEIRVGEHTRIRIYPGGETNLAAVRAALESATANRDKLFAALGVKDIDEAASAFEELRKAKGDLDACEKELDTLQSDTIEDRVRLAETQYKDACKRATRSMQEAGIEDLADAAEALRRRDEAEQASEDATSEEQLSHAAVEGARQRLDTATERGLAAQREVAGLQTQLNEATTQISTMERIHGADTDRARKILALQTEKTQKSEATAIHAAELEKLQPDMLEQDINRLESALEAARQSIHTAENEQAGARARMRLNGTTDPQADVILAQSRHEQANTYFKELEVQANAITLLKDMAQEAQNQMAAEFTRPLAEAVKGYLECIFGAGSAMELSWVAGKSNFSIQHINRQGFGAFPFSALSGGAREQVGVAMRLAMAEVLAADHDDCLPVVLDDSFTNSDPERVAMLHRMLYRAAERGLQVIVLSSNPGHYGTLGGKEVRLSRPTFSGAYAQPTAIAAAVDDSGDQEEDPQNVPADMIIPATEQNDTFEQQLRNLGGSAGNQTLRETLRWDEATYDAVKSGLLADGKIKTGRGRGGSVQLVDGA